MGTSSKMLEQFLNSKGDSESFKDVKWKYVLLNCGDVFTEKMVKEILAIQTKKEQDLAVVKHLSARGGGATTLLIKALENGYGWVSAELNNFIIRHEKTEKKLRSKSVPFKTAHEMDRPELVKEIRDVLIKAAVKGRFWVVVHGMMGSGKTIVAAQALRDPVIALDTFKQDICWLSLGHGDIGDDDYLLKVQSLCEQLDHNFRPGNWEHCSVFLRNYFVNHQHSLLVLDDVHSSLVLTKFDFGIPVLVTTQNLNNVPWKFSGMTHTIKIETGFTLAQSQTLMSNYLGIDVDGLPEECKQIHEKYKGSPLVMALVCGHLLQFQKLTTTHWRDIWKKLKNRELNRIRHNSGSSEDLKAAVKWMVDLLPENYRKMLQDFALFWEDLFVPQKVFELLWDLEEVDTEEILCNLEKRSLVLKREENILPHGSFSGSSNTTYCYSVHDLLHDYLKQSDETNKKKHHTTLVDKYISKCAVRDGQYNFKLLPRDGYIHMFLAYHISRSSHHDFFPKVFFDLDFLQTKIEVSGLFDVLHDFKTYAQYFGKNRNTVETYRRFLQQNGSLLFSSSDIQSNGAVFFDLKQLALSEPKTSPVYQQAIQNIHFQSQYGREQKVYYNWCNQNNFQDFPVLSHCPHFPKKTKWAVFSPDGKLVASIGNDKALKVWDSTTGREVNFYEEHESSVTACSFSPCGKFVLTATERGELKLWDVSENQVFFGNGFSNHEGQGDGSNDVPATPEPRRGSLPFSPFVQLSPRSVKSSCQEAVHNFEKNNTEGITACAFSKTTEHMKLLAASGYNNGTIKIWEMSSKKLLRHLSGHNQEVTCLTFSPKDMLASASRDCTIILWDLKSGNIIREFQHFNYVVFSCQFNKTGEILLSSADKFVWLWKIEEENSQPEQYDGLASTFVVNHCTFSPDEAYIVGGTTDCSVIIWSMETGKIVATLRGHSDPVNCVYFSKDGEKLLSASSDGTVRLWTTKELLNKTHSSSQLGLTKHFDVKFLDGQKEILPIIAAPDTGNNIQIITTLEGKQNWSTKSVEEISSSCFSPDGQMLVYTTKNGSIKVHQLTSEYHSQKSCSLTANAKIINSYFSSCGEYFVTCLEGGPMLLWDAKIMVNMHRISLLGHIKDTLGCKMFKTKDNRSRMLSWAVDGKLKVWDLNRTRCLVTISHGNENVTCGDANPECNILVSGSVDKTLRVWQYSTGEHQATFEMSSCVRSCCLNANAELVAVGEDSGSITVFNIGDQTVCHEFKRHKRFVYDLHFSNDSSKLVSAGDGLCWWNLQSGYKNPLQQSFSYLGGEIHKLFVSQDFTSFVMVDSNGILFILKEICLGN